jgi:ElaB/YqjD/DUF883 family membrane-anchored ribosome-binding protein
MAETADLAPTRSKTNGPSRSRSRAASNRAAATRAAASRESDPNLEDQVQQLQDDLKAITRTLTRLSEQKASEVRDTASSQVNSLLKTGKDAIDEAGDQVNALERQLKTMIRDKPLTAIGAAIGAGFILALMARM